MVKTKLSIILPTYNRLDALRRCLDALFKSLSKVKKDAVEIIVVDNGSTDGTLRYLKKSPVKVLSEATPSSYAARNTGAEAAKGEWFMFIDDDVEVSYGFMETFFAKYYTCDYGLIVPAVFWWSPYKLVRLTFGGFLNNGISDAAPAACVLVKREAFRKFGLVVGSDLSFTIDVARRHGSIYAYDLGVFHRLIEGSFEMYKRQFRYLWQESFVRLLRGIVGDILGGMGNLLEFLSCLAVVERSEKYGEFLLAPLARCGFRLVRGIGGIVMLLGFPFRKIGRVR